MCDTAHYSVACPLADVHRCARTQVINPETLIADSPATRGIVPILDTHKLPRNLRVTLRNPHIEVGVSLLDQITPRR